MPVVELAFSILTSVRGLEVFFGAEKAVSREVAMDPEDETENRARVVAIFDAINGLMLVAPDSWTEVPASDRLEHRFAVKLTEMGLLETLCRFEGRTSEGIAFCIEVAARGRQHQKMMRDYVNLALLARGFVPQPSTRMVGLPKVRPSRSLQLFRIAFLDLDRQHDIKRWVLPELFRCIPVEVYPPPCATTEKIFIDGPDYSSDPDFPPLLRWASCLKYMVDEEVSPSLLVHQPPHDCEEELKKLSHVWNDASQLSVQLHGPLDRMRVAGEALREAESKIIKATENAMLRVLSKCAGYSAEQLSEALAAAAVFPAVAALRSEVEDRYRATASATRGAEEALVAAQKELFRHDPPPQTAHQPTGTINSTAPVPQPNSATSGERPPAETAETFQNPADQLDELVDEKLAHFGRTDARRSFLRFAKTDPQTTVDECLAHMKAAGFEHAKGFSRANIARKLRDLADEGLIERKTGRAEKPKLLSGRDIDTASVRRHR